MKKNDIIELEIIDMGTDGEGIGKVDGYTFFVKDGVIGDRVKAVVTKPGSGYGYAKALEILVPSPKRTTPACDICSKCGGCQIMQLSYDEQLKFKENKVKNNLKRLGGIDFEGGGIDFVPIIGMKNPLHFRNKMQFPIGRDKDGNVCTGFYAGRTHYIVPTKKCPAAPEDVDEILAAVRNFVEKNKIDFARHILIREGFATGQIMVCLVIGRDSLGGKPNRNATGKKCDDRIFGDDKNRKNKSGESSLEDEFVETLLKTNSNISSISLNINKEDTNVILGKKVVPLFGTVYIEDKMCQGSHELTFRISPLSFYQVNPEQTEVLYGKALEFANLTGNETVWDLYCGTGTISLFLAGHAKKVYGVEIVPEAIEDAKINAENNGIKNAEFFCGKSEEIFPQMVKGELFKGDKTSGNDEGFAKSSVKEFEKETSADVVVVDPPRKGCDVKLLDAILEVGPKRIVYVSCDSATLARDIKHLTDRGKYRLEKVQPVDMFPHTVHVETVCLMTRK